MTQAPAEFDQELHAIAASLSEHLDREEAWLRESRARFSELRDAIVGYDLQFIGESLADQRAHDERAIALQVARDELRSRIARRIGLTPEQATLSALMERLPPRPARELRRKQQSLQNLTRETAALQQQVQRLALHVHSISQTVLFELFGVDREGSRYAADGALDVGRGQPRVQARS